MWNLFYGVLAGLIASILFSLGLRLYKQINDRRPFARIHGFSKNETVLITFPGRSSASRSGLLKDKLVSFEDMLAVNYVERILTLSGWKDNLIDFCENNSFGKLDIHDPAKNLVLICSPKSNNITKKYLDSINQNLSLNWKFEVDNQGQMMINVDGGRWDSASYSQEDVLRTKGKSIEESTIDDIAVVIRSNNPFNPKTKVLIVAGIRGIGTWGAAKYLRQHAKDLVRKTGGKDFACLLKVKYNNWRIEKTELTDICKVLD